MPEGREMGGREDVWVIVAGMVSLGFHRKMQCFVGDRHVIQNGYTLRTCSSEQRESDSAGRGWSTPRKRTTHNRITAPVELWR
jgi:hypothetical protein